MTLGEYVADRSLKEIIEGKAQKPTTKRILRRCLPSLKQVVDSVASPEAGGMALSRTSGTSSLEVLTPGACA
jgi:hypothetical protein